MKKRFIAALTSLAVLFVLSLSTTASVLAYEVPQEVKIASSDFTPLEETSISREYALEVLGISSEDAEGMEFYVSTTNIVAPRANITVSSGESATRIDTITVGSNSTKYGNIVTINGTRVAAGVGAVYNSGSTDASCKVYLDRYSEAGRIFTFTMTPSSNNQQKGFVDISRNTRVQFKYVCPVGVQVTFVSVIGVAG